MGRKRKDFDQAVEMYYRGLSIQDVAEFYGITRQAMWKVLRRRGVVFRSPIRSSVENRFYRGGPTRNIHWVAQKAIRKGVLVVGPCEVCGLVPAVVNGRQRIQAHHDDYNFPMRVRWLCQIHHWEWHQLNRPIPRGQPPMDKSAASSLGGKAAWAKLSLDQRRLKMAALRAKRKTA